MGREVRILSTQLEFIRPHFDVAHQEGIKIRTPPDTQAILDLPITTARNLAAILTRAGLRNAKLVVQPTDEPVLITFGWVKIAAGPGTSAAAYNSKADRNKE